ncbi:MAG: hypothetical protein WDN24_15305 [Sphingomonas sp.]
MANQLTGAWDGSSYAIATATLTIAYEYDAAGNRIKTTDAAGNASFAYYDKLGRKTAEVDRERYLTGWTHDAEGNVLSERRYATQAGTPVTASPPAVSTHADDRVTDFTYDRMGRRLSETRTGVAAWTLDFWTGALAAASTSAVVTYAYNALGQVTSKTEANGDTVSYAYDRAGRLVRESRAGFGDYSGTSVTPTVRYYYNGLGALVRTRQGGADLAAGDRIATNAYDGAGRLASTTDAAGFTRGYLYDAAGRVLAETYTRQRSDDSTVSEARAYRYDAVGRVITETQAWWDGSAWVPYDAAATPFDAARTRYNAHGEVTGRGITAGPDATAVYHETFDYDSGGRLWRTNSGDGVLKFFVQDKAGNQTLVMTSTGADLSGLNAGNYTASIASTGDTGIADAVTTVLAYSKRGELVETREPDRQLASWSSGNTLVRAQAYNAFGEAASETDARGYTTSYAYNTMGRMTAKVSPPVSVTSVTGAISTVNPAENLCL